MTAGSNPSTTSPWPLPVSVQTHFVNGYPMASAERGTGTPVVLIHGAGNDYRFWVPQMEPLAARHRIIAASLRHYYPEPWRGDGEFTMRQHIDDVITFVRQLGVGPVHLVGHSRGATLAMYAVADAPDIARSLVVAEGGVGMPGIDPPTPEARKQGEEYVQSLVAKLKRGDIDGCAEEFITRVSGPGAWRAIPEPTRQSIRDNAWTIPAGFIDAQDWPPFGPEEAKGLHLPVLLVGGARSPARFLAVLDRLESFLPNVMRVSIPDAAHPMSRMNPAAFNSAVLSFFEATTGDA
jgi:pimeloyl-ACP methyl ester carboxylesterase